MGRKLTSLLFVLALSATAFAAPKKGKSARDRNAGWTFKATRDATALFVPITLRTESPTNLVANTVANIAAKVPERTLVQEIHPGDVQSVRSLRLVVEADREGLAKSARIEMTMPGSKTSRSFALGKLDAQTSLVLPSFELVDVNFDGYLDVRVLRERSSKVTMHSYLTYDKTTDAFLSSTLTQSLGRLENVAVDGKALRVVSQSSSPARPVYASYTVTNNALSLERECSFTMLLGSQEAGTLRARLRNGAAFREVSYARTTLPHDLAASCEGVKSF
jgi:hypothetical protein